MDLKKVTHCVNTVFISVRDDKVYFLPSINAACFKISFSISSCFTLFLNLINSFSSSVLLSFTLKEPETLYLSTHTLIVDFAIPYSLFRSAKDLPLLYNATICFLNSSSYRFAIFLFLPKVYIYTIPLFGILLSYLV